MSESLERRDMGKAGHDDDKIESPVVIFQHLPLLRASKGQAKKKTTQIEGRVRSERVSMKLEGGVGETGDGHLFDGSKTAWPTRVHPSPSETSS